MYKHLYDKFSDWYRGGTIYFYSDPHFNDKEAQTFRKNYIGDDAQVKSINSVLGKNDTLIILGDIGDVEYVRKLRGYHVLIKGNHDAGSFNYKRRVGFIDRSHLCEDGKYHWADKDNGLFDEVYEGPLWISERIILSHEPLPLTCALNIHGHDHAGQVRPDIYHLNFCAELINYRPVPLKWVIENGFLKPIDSLHRITIDRATEKKNDKSNLTFF